MKDEKQLKEITIDQLKVGEIQKDTILWGKIKRSPCVHDALILLVQDKNRELISVLLYNQIEKEKKRVELDKIFPLLTEIGIK